MASRRWINQGGVLRISGVRHEAFEAPMIRAVDEWARIDADPLSDAAAAQLAWGLDPQLCNPPLYLRTVTQPDQTGATLSSTIRWRESVADAPRDLGRGHLATTTAPRVMVCLAAWHLPRVQPRWEPEGRDAMGLLVAAIPYLCRVGTAPDDRYVRPAAEVAAVDVSPGEGIIAWVPGGAEVSVTSDTHTSSTFFPAGRWVCVGVSIASGHGAVARRLSSTVRVNLGHVA